MKVFVDFIYSYFMPKRPIRFVFYSDDMIPVEIFGIVESVSVNPFSKDPEILVSIICPDPYFTALNPTVITGKRWIRWSKQLLLIIMELLKLELMLKLLMLQVLLLLLSDIQFGDPEITYFTVAATVNSTKYFEMSSIPMRKYVQNVNISTGVITNLLSNVS